MGALRAFPAPRRVEFSGGYLEWRQMMKKTIQDDKTFSRADNSGFVEADLNASIDPTLTLLYDEYKNRIEVKNTMAPCPPVKCYISKLNHVFMNLLVNAIQTLEGTGAIEIRTRTEDGKVVIESSDTRCGIPEKVIHKMFDPFFATKPAGGGKGLGLSILRGIVELHKEQFSVKSRQDFGSRFTLTFRLDLSID
jgi:two-component system, NtrC family, sensor kinase